MASAPIGELVMEGLRSLDPVAYVRFASVYRDFREAADFHEVLGEIAGHPALGTPTTTRRTRSRPLKAAVDYKQ